jgi:hypothetical protein
MKQMLACTEEHGGKNVVFKTSLVYTSHQQSSMHILPHSIVRLPGCIR